MPMIIKSALNYTPNKCNLGLGEHLNTPLAPFSTITAKAPELAELLSDEHSSMYSADNIEIMIQSLERLQAEQLQEPEPEPAPAPRRKKQEPPADSD